MGRKVSLKCPLCGMVSDLEHIERQGNQYPTISIKEYGGKVKGEKTGRGKAKGRIEYKIVEDKENLKEVYEFLAKRIKELHELKGNFDKLKKKGRNK
jgi:hypothetical protein